MDIQYVLFYMRFYSYRKIIDYLRMGYYKVRIGKNKEKY